MRLIDADELKEAMKEHTDYKGYLVCDPEEIIDLVPTVERPHGEWKQDGTCSECGVYSSLNKNTAYFCPNCGSDNRKRGEAK